MVGHPSTQTSVCEPVTVNETASEDTGQGAALPLVQEQNWSGYGQAIVHLAWLKDGQVRHLLFGMVELRPTEFPIIDSSEEQTFGGNRRSRSCLHYRRLALSVADATRWYRRCLEGDVQLPVERSDNRTGGGVPLCGGPFVGWPVWPTLAASNELDFAADWVQGSRAHFLHPRAELHPGALAAIRSENNRRQLENWLHFDLVDLYNDYLGAVCLIAPNPLFRHIEKIHLDPPVDGFAETVAYKLINRAGPGVDGTCLEITNEGLRGRLTPVQVDFGNASVQVLNFAEPINKEGRRVTHPRYGLLAWNEPIPLVRSIHTHFNVVSRRKKVTVPSGGKKKPAYEYSVPELAYGGDAVIGRLPGDESIEARTIAAVRRRAMKETEGKEHWFQDAPEDAAQFIRDTVGRAQRRVLIADPYFAGWELFAFGHAIQRAAVELRVLTSAQALKETNTDPATMLKQAVETFKSYSAEPAIRVLDGKALLHDRFLLVDEAVWFSGNSLNSIGVRASMIVALRDPEPVAARLNGMWAAATPLAAWLEKRSPDHT